MIIILKVKKASEQRDVNGGHHIHAFLSGVFITEKNSDSRRLVFRISMYTLPDKYMGLMSELLSHRKLLALGKAHFNAGVLSSIKG